MKKSILLSLVLVALMVLMLPAWPLYGEEAEKDDEDLFEISMEELLNIEIAIATRSLQSIEDAPSIVSVITAGEIERMGARDLRDVLRTVPGFEMGMRATSYTKIGIRGVSTANTEKVKLLIDEVPVNEHLEGSGTVIFGELPVDDIERIEILRGPGSALYGNSAFVGVINIITKKAEDIDDINVTIKGGSFNTKEVGLLFGKDLDDFKLKANFNYHDTNGMEIPIEEDSLSRDPINQSISLAGTDRGHTIEGRKKITTGLNLSFKNLYFKGLYVSVTKDHYLAGGYAVNEETELRTYQLNTMLGYKASFGEKLEIEPRIYAQIYKLDNLWQNYPPGYQAAGLTYLYGKYQNTTATQRRYAGDLKLTYNLSDNNTFIFGTSYETIKYTDDGQFDNEANPFLTKDNLTKIGNIMSIDPTRKVFSVFAQEHWNVSDKVALTAGIRYDNYNNDAGSTTNPRFAVVWKPFKKATLKFLYGQAFRAPTFAELFLYFDNGFIRGNPDNEPETIKTGEIQFSYDFNERMRFRINYFYNSINNLIDLDFVFDGAVLDHIEYRNINAEIVVQGIETELKLLWGDYSYFFFNYSFQDGKNKDTNNALIGMAHHISNIGLNLGLSEKFNLNITANLVGPRDRAPKEELRERLKGYAFLNSTLIWKQPVKNLKLYLSIYNLFNVNCRTPDSGGNLSNDFPLPNSARSLIAGISYSF
ncbi:MAG: TonB-dependent receptor [bacterium]|nr:TonB-dependent receptor [bacterium]